MSHRSFALTLLSVAALALGDCAPHKSSDSGAEVRSAALGVVAAYNHGDAHAAAAFDAPDYVGVYHGTANTVGPAADEAAMKAEMAQAKVDWQLGTDKVSLSKAGDLGIFEAPYTFVVSIPGAPTTTERGTWIAIFKRQEDGSMKLWRSVASDGPAAPAGPPQPAG
jgi:ketosteroid isomerase-like protein